MKLIKLNESQYERLFEIEDIFSNPSQTPENLGDERYNIMNPVTTDKDGEESLVDSGGSNIEKHNRLKGSKIKSDPMSQEGPYLTHRNRGGF